MNIESMHTTWKGFGDSVFESRPKDPGGVTNVKAGKEVDRVR